MSNRDYLAATSFAGAGVFYVLVLLINGGWL